MQVLWRTIVLSVALRHPTIEHCLAELRRNESLRRLIGIESEDRVPTKWNLSRFLDRLGLSEFRDRYNQRRPHWALVPETGGDPWTPAEVYQGDRKIGIPKWQAWARHAKATLETLLDEVA